MIPAAFDYIAASSVDEAIEMLRERLMTIRTEHRADPA